MIRRFATLIVLLVAPLAPSRAAAQPVPAAAYDLEHVRADVSLVGEPTVHARLFLRRLAEADSLTLESPGVAFDSVVVVDAGGTRRRVAAVPAGDALTLPLTASEREGGRLTIEFHYRPGPLLGAAGTDSARVVWTDRAWLPSLGAADRTTAELFLSLDPRAALVSGLTEVAPPAGAPEGVRLLLASRAVAPTALAFAAGAWGIDADLARVGGYDVPVRSAQGAGAPTLAAEDVRHALACLSAWYTTVPPAAQIAVVAVPDTIAGPIRPGLVLLPAGAGRHALYAGVARQWAGALVRDADELNERIARRAAEACLAVAPDRSLRDGDREVRDAVSMYLQRFAHQAAGRAEWAALPRAVPESAFGPAAPRLHASYRHTGRRVTIEVHRLDDGTAPLELEVEVAGLFESSRRSWTIDEPRASLVMPFAEIPRFVWIAAADSSVALDLQQTPEAWVSLLQQSDAAPARLAAARALLAAEPDPLLSVGLRSAFAEEADPAVRAALATALARVAPRDAARRAMLDAVQDAEAAVRIAALDALARMGGLAAEDAARDAAYNDPDPAVQAEAVAALVRLGVPAATDVLRSALVTPSPDDRIRLRALQLVPESALDPVEAAAHLSAIADTAAAYRARLASVKALVALPAGDARDDALLARLDDDALGVRLAAARALAASTQPALRQRAVERLANHSDPLLRRLAAPGAAEQ